MDGQGVHEPHPGVAEPFVVDRIADVASTCYIQPELSIHNLPGPCIFSPGVGVLRQGWPFSLWIMFLAQVWVFFVKVGLFLCGLCF